MDWHSTETGVFVLGYSEEDPEPVISYCLSTTGEWAPTGWQYVVPEFSHLSDDRMDANGKPAEDLTLGETVCSTSHLPCPFWMLPFVCPRFLLVGIGAPFSLDLGAWDPLAGTHYAVLDVEALPLGRHPLVCGPCCPAAECDRLGGWARSTC